MTRHGREAFVEQRREVIVRAALGLLDEVGFEGLTLRQLARHLHMHAPGLYWYFRSKQDLIDLMAKAILDERLYPIDPPGPRQSWEAWLVELACSTREALLAYRDGARVVASAFLLRTNAITPALEQALTVLESAGFSRVAGLAGAMTILRYAAGAALDEQASPIPSRSGRTRREQLAALPHPGIDATRWPRTAGAMREVLEHHLRDPDRMFRVGAEMIVRGLATGR